jgi:hypothetical protein
MNQNRRTPSIWNEAAVNLLSYPQKLGHTKVGIFFVETKNGLSFLRIEKMHYLCPVI